jgi:hypothetical protein
MRQACLAVLLLGLLTNGCTSQSPSTPAPVPIDVTGTWNGAITVQDLQARMTWTLTQATGGAVTGTVLIRLSTDEVLLNGLLTGTLTGSTLGYTISIGPGGIPSRPTCTGQLTGSMAATIGPTSTLVGPLGVSSSSCTPPFSSATLTLTRS